MRSGVYAILDPAHCGGRDPLRVADAMLAGGAVALQLRSKLGSDRERLALARDLATRCRVHDAVFVMNDRADLALLAGAGALHLGQDDLSVPDARRIVGDLSIGVSTHGTADIERALAYGANLLGFGPVFATSSKERPSPVVGVDGLRRALAQSTAPVVAIGGITLENAAAVWATGVPLVAAISALSLAEDPELATRALGARR